MMRAAKAREGLKRGAEMGVIASVQVPGGVAALMVGFSSDVLRRVGILVVPEEGGSDVEITVSRGSKEIIDKALRWCWREPEAQNVILARIYLACYRLVNAQANNVDLKKVAMGPDGLLLRAAADDFPPFVGLVEYIEDVKGLAVLPDDDRRAIQGVAVEIYRRLEVQGFSDVKEWQRCGWVPENMFVASD